MIVASATLHNFDVKNLAKKLMKFPTWIDLKGQDSVPGIQHFRKMDHIIQLNAIIYEYLKKIMALCYKNYQYLIAIRHTEKY